MRNWLLKLVYGIGRWVGRQHAPFSHKLVTVADYHAALEIIQPGDVLLSYIRGELSNLFIPGEWKHAAIFYGDIEGRPTIVEAIGIGVVEKDLLVFMLRKDLVGIFRPKFADTRTKLIAAANARSAVGLPYDYEFKGDNKAFYCSELVCSAYDLAMDGGCPMQPWLRMGNMTVIPQDIAKAADKWENVWVSGRPGIG